MVRYQKPHIKERKIKANLFFSDIWQIGSNQDIHNQKLYQGILLAEGDCGGGGGGGSSGVY